MRTMGDHRRPAHEDQAELPESRPGSSVEEALGTGNSIKFEDISKKGVKVIRIELG
jgi:hypothetical protein